MVCVSRQVPKRGGVLNGTLSALVGVLLLAHCVAAEQALPVDEPDEPIGTNCQKTDFEQLDLTQISQNRLVANSLYEHDGRAIRKIRIVSANIFDETDPAEDRWLYRGFNRLHINTRETTVRSQLLFAEGEPLQWRVVRETERILRTRNYLTSAYIMPEVICDEHIDLLVITRDAWVTEPEVYFGYEGGETRSGFGIKDGNFLGTGDNLSIGYTQDDLRSSISYDYRSPHLLGTHMTARLFYAEKSDGSDKIASLEQPFYSLDTPWAAGFITQNLSEISVVRNAGEDINEYRHKIKLNEAYFGLAIKVTSEASSRVLIGYTEEDDEYFEVETTQQGIPQDRAAKYPWLAFQYIENNFETYTNLNQIQRTEDVALGVNLYFRAGYGGSNIGNDSDVIRFKGHYSNVIGVGANHLLQLDTHLDGRYYPQIDADNSTIAETRIAYNFFINENNRWYARASYAKGHDLAQHEQLTTGGSSGLRGYPTDYQRGNQRYLLTLERRHYSEIHFLNVIRMGGVAFVDFGKAWGGDGNRGNTHLSNVGVGLRFSSSKARVGNLLHIDVAAPTGTRTDLRTFQWLIKGETVF